jgi:L-asparagine permease
VIVMCQMQLARLAKRGELLRPAFRMPGAPVTGWITLAFLLAVLVLMAFDSPVGTWTIASLLIVIPALMLGWRLCRERVLELAAVRDGFTGPYPLVANRPGPGAKNKG